MSAGSHQKYGIEFVKEMLCICDYIKLFEPLGIAFYAMNAFLASLRNEESRLRVLVMKKNSRIFTE